MTKIALIELGKWGKNHARALNQLKKEGIIDELYFYDVNKETLDQMSKIYDAVPIYESQELLDLNLDRVDIAVPQIYIMRSLNLLLKMGLIF